MTDTRNPDATFAAGDTMGFQAPLGTPAPEGFEDLVAPWICMGYLDTTGYIYKLAETLKDINASGQLDPIRSIVTAAPKTLQATYLERMNPVVAALYDDVPLALLQPAGATTVASYILPEIPTDNQYCYVFDTFDNDKAIRLFAPSGKVTDRGNDEPQQADADMLQMTLTFYPALIGSTRGSIQRYLDYGSLDLSPFFT